MKAKIICILVVTLLIATALPAVGTLNKLKNKATSNIQNFGVEWHKTFGGSGYDTFYDVDQTADGGYIVCGKHEENDLYYPYIVRVDSNGDEIWNWTIQEFYYEEVWYDILDNWVSSVKESSDGKIVACASIEFEYEGENLWGCGLLKLDESGNEEWLKPLGVYGEWWFIGTEFVEVTDGFVISGYGATVEDPEDDRSAILVKTDLTGEMIWHKLYNYGEDWDESYALCETSDNGFLTTGSVDDVGSKNDYRMIKTDSNGNLEWSKTFGGDDADYSFNHDCFQTEDGGYIMGGQSYSFGAGRLDAWIVKADSQGNMLWDKAYGGTSTDTCWSMEMTDDNKYVICVTYNFDIFGADKDDIHLVKLDDDGFIEWIQIYGGPDRQIGTHVSQTSDGGLIVAGRDGRSHTKNSDAILVKFAPFDNQRPNTPDKPAGDAEGEPGKEYTFATGCTDPDGDDVLFKWDWGDGNVSDWLDTNSATHSWPVRSKYFVKVMAKDEHGGETDWSEAHEINIPRPRFTNRPMFNQFLRYLELFPMLRILFQRLVI
jgi:hypothetical protein